MVSAWSAVTGVGVELSVTRTVKFDVPAAVGVPEIVPVPLNVRPLGSVPLSSDQTYGEVPPVAARLCEYAVCTVPAGSVAVVTESAAGLITMVSALSAVTGVGVELSVTRTVKFDVPAAVGVPEIVPVPLSVRPLGNVPLEQRPDIGRSASCCGEAL